MRKYQVRYGGGRMEKDRSRRHRASRPPYFLGLANTYSEMDLETAILRELQ